MWLNPEEKEVGKTNFASALGSKLLRRDFLKKQIKEDLASKKGLGAHYYGYGKVTEPLRVGVIGTGDEGSVLIGALNPDYMAVKSIADIRPYSVWRAFHGEHYTASAAKARPGLMSIYKWTSEDAARKEVKVYGAYQELIEKAKDDGVEAVIIALPLHLHAPCAIAAMKAGLHVITEKLMGHSVHECKEMARAAKAGDKPLYLAVGHQRHYNILYDNAVELIRKGALGALHYIRAQWHRGNLPGNDSWRMAMPRKAKPHDDLAGKLEEDLAEWKAQLAKLQKQMVDDKESKSKRDEYAKAVAELERKIPQLVAQISDEAVEAGKFDYEDKKVTDAAGKLLYDRPAIEELIRWRLWERTGGGLMAELGSHQLDAASIFVAAMHGGKKQQPLSVVASANRPLFPPDRDCEDHVFCIIEFPAPGYDAKDPQAAKKKIGVQYASINGNGFGGYGETVFGTEGTLVIETEKEAMLYRTHETMNKTKLERKKSKDKEEGVSLAAAEAGDPESAAIGLLGTLPAERGYAEEMEHFAWCVRNAAPENQPRCHAELAMGDAIIALTTNIAARTGERIEFKPEWFKVESDETPEGVKPDLGRYK
jgi:predicted dehydrogenase